ncbi:polysaccharide biosynthesis tyrosine autokinase [Cronbergia sp. UHCC 0137]|uniref:GumC family protein n=1 Tax=Cronbergia sp. UHCC 0137 TaxID=3110239 RepID=UPI002B21F7B4|nr:polysaccharide biosynthesis tyrosine autokinase [Cronbergia sp. UHCC 0137]MEA5616520.1 polysaccharide biosynthesis tyrosine autokinase [Cronbergia sp. UHCC 0137]
MDTTGLNTKKLVNTYTQKVVDIRQISTTIARRRYFILGVSCIVMSVTSLLAIITKPMYQSSMQVMVSFNLDEKLLSNENQENIKNELTNSPILSAKYMTQMKLMASSNLIQRAVNLLRSNYPNITIEDIKGKDEAGNPVSLQVNPITNSAQGNQVFIVSFQDRDPIKTKRVLQALQRVYQDYNVEQKKQNLEQGLGFIHDRLPKATKDALKAEKQLELFRKKHNIVDPVVQSKILLESVANIQKQRQTTRAQLQDVKARYDNIAQKVALSIQNAQAAASLSRSSRYQALLSEIKKTEMALVEARIRYTDHYPVVKKLKDQYKIQVGLFQQELKNQLTNINNQVKPPADFDPKLVNELNQLQTTAIGLMANENNLAKSEQKIHSELSKYPALIAEYNNLRAEVDINRQARQQVLLSQQSLSMRLALAGFDWQVLEEPDLGILIGYRRWFLILSGVVISPFLGVASALIWEWLNQKIVSPQDLQSLTNVLLLGSVPSLNKRSFKHKLKEIFGYRKQNLKTSIIETRPHLPNHETLDMIYQNIQIYQDSADCKSLMLTSCLPGEGKTTLALGLGASAARMHQRVLIIDANLRLEEPSSSKSLHTILQLSNDWGLSLLLVDDINTQLDHYIQPIHPLIDILTAGPTPEDVVSLLSSGRMKQLIETFEQIYDLVLIDAPSVLNTVDARILASCCDGVVLVGGVGKVTPKQLMEATEILSKLNLIGIVANEANFSA